MAVVSGCRAVMSELQAVLEFQVELFKFFNIDLFQRGSVTAHLILTYLTHTHTHTHTLW